MIRSALFSCLMAVCVLSGAASAADTPAVDLFAPVKAGMDSAAAAVAKWRASGASADPAAINALLDSGEIDEAVALLPTLQGDAREVLVTRANVLLTVQDFAAARPLFEEIAARPDRNDAERQALYAWLFALDDMARIDELTRAHSLEPGTTAPVPDLLAAGRLALELLNYDRAEACFQRALERVDASGSEKVVGITDFMTGKGGGSNAVATAARSEALKGLGQVAYKRRDYDASLAKITEALARKATPANLYALAETLIRLGRTDEAISAAEWTIRLNRYHTMGHYYLGNGYARRNYTELAAAYPAAFSNEAGRAGLKQADDLLAAGDRAGARAAYEAVRGANPGWADPLARLASLDFEDGLFDSARDRSFEALHLCPEYGRAHAILAKALESQEFLVDVHRADYERRFAEAPMPEVPGIETFIMNWNSLSPRHQKRVALSVAPWGRFIPVLVEGGSTYYIKPLYMLLSETPGQEPLRDQRINYDSRLWDDVRGCGGYHTVTGIEDVERTIFDNYDTVLHELTHQVHSVLTADQNRVIREHYIRAKERDDRTKNGFLSRYAGGSVYEYFAEGANALKSPRRDAYDTREVVRDRLDSIDPDLRTLVETFFAQTDMSGSYPVAYVNAGLDRQERGEIAPAIEFYEKALARSPDEEGALQWLTYALSLKGDDARAIEAAERALAAHPTSGAVVTTAAEALWFAGRGLGNSVTLLAEARPRVRSEDRYQIDLGLGRYHWIAGDAAASITAYDSALVYQSDNPSALWGRAGALALAKRWDEAFKLYDEAVRLRTGVIDLRCDYARDLLIAGRVDAAKAQLDEALLLEAENPVAEALRGWVALSEGRNADATAHLQKSLEWGPWSDLTRILLARAALARGDAAAAAEALAPVRERIAANTPPEYVYREKLSTWRSVHELPAVERNMLEEFEKP
jgi:tetratricopeptide (TPR) repeat protein